MGPDPAGASSVTPREYYDAHRLQRTGESAEGSDGRPGGEWLKVDFMKCLGRGGYGDVYEATITCGPLQGARAVAKRALKRREGKIKWRKRNWHSISVERSAATEMTWTTYYNLKTNPGPLPTGDLLSATSFYSGSSASSPSLPTLGAEADTGEADAGGADAGALEAAEYLEVEDYINRLIAVSSPDIAVGS